MKVTIVIDAPDWGQEIAKAFVEWMSGELDDSNMHTGDTAQIVHSVIKNSESE